MAELNPSISCYLFVTPSSLILDFSDLRHLTRILFTCRLIS